MVKDSGLRRKEKGANPRYCMSALRDSSVSNMFVVLSSTPIPAIRANPNSVSANGGCNIENPFLSICASVESYDHDWFKEGIRFTAYEYKYQVTKIS